MSASGPLPDQDRKAPGDGSKRAVGPSIFTNIARDNRNVCSITEGPHCARPNEQMTCRIIVWVRDGALRPTAVDRPWASCTFQTGNSCTSSFLSGRFLRKIMLQKARRGKEINRGVVDQPFSHLYFSAKMKKAKGCMG